MSSVHSLKAQAAASGTLPTPERLSPDSNQQLSPPVPPGKPGGTLATKELRVDEQSLLTPSITPETRPALLPQPPALSCSYDSRWPDWARLEENLPTATARDLYDRAAQLCKTQSKADASISYAVQDRSWTKTLQLLPQDSAVWATLIRSRWLVIQTTKGNLELWDIEGSCEDKPVAAFHALCGSVDGFYVLNGSEGAVELSLSTTSFHVYSFDLDLPHRCESRSCVPSLVPKDIFSGWAGLKDNMEGTWAFTKHQGTTIQGFLYRRNLPLPSVHLACKSDVEENQNILDILLRPNIIVVARNRNIDLYNPSKIPTLINAQRGKALPYLTLDHSFPSPQSSFIHRAKLLRRNPARLKMVDDQSIAYAVYLDEGWLVSEIQCKPDQDHSGPSRKYNMFPPREVTTVNANTLALSWGESGSRMVELNDWQLIMKFASSQTLPDGSARCTDSRDGPDVNYYRTLAVWPMPLELGDIPRCVAFDEATGIAAVGMASGKVLVADAAGTGFLPPLPQSNLDDDDGHFGSPYMRFKPAESPPHPSCKEWRGLARNPAMHKPRKIKSPELASEGAPGWTRDVERYYPHANDPSYYLSIPWLVRDLAGIPFGARCVMVSSEQIDPIKGANAAIIEVEAEFGIGGRLLLLLWGGGVEWQLFKFRSLVTSDNIVNYLKTGVILATLCDPKPLSLDPVILGQWEVWGVRRQAAKQMNKNM